MSSPNLSRESILDHDILLIIFKSSTDMFSPGPQKGCLTALRYYSHTCKGWRYLILQTPFLWAQTIDFGDPSMVSEYWRETVLSRSGHSQLWIRCGDEAYSRALEPLRVVVDRNWHRIQRLSIVLPTEIVDKFLRWSSIFYRGAPHLELFDVSPANTSKLLAQMPPLEELFAGNAPSLMEIHLYQLFEPPKETSWFPNLRVLHSHRHDITKLQDLFHVIQATPLLEDLLVKFRGQDIAETRLPQVSLPHLKRLSLTANHFPHLSTILSHLVTPQSCKLHLIDEYRQFVDPRNIDVAPIVRAIKGLISHYQPTSLSLSVAREEWAADDYFFISDAFGQLLSLVFRRINRAGSTYPSVLLTRIIQAYQSQLQNDDSDIGSCVQHVQVKMTMRPNDSEDYPPRLVGGLLSSFRWLKTISIVYSAPPGPGPEENPLTTLKVQLADFMNRLPSTVRVVNLRFLVEFPYDIHRGDRRRAQIQKAYTQMTRRYGQSIFCVCLRSQLGWNFFFENGASS